MKQIYTKPLLQESILNIQIIASSSSSNYIPKVDEKTEEFDTKARNSGYYFYEGFCE